MRYLYNCELCLTFNNSDVNLTFNTMRGVKC